MYNNFNILFRKPPSSRVGMKAVTPVFCLVYNYYSLGSVDQLNIELEKRKSMEQDLWARVDKLKAQYAGLRATLNSL